MAARGPARGIGPGRSGRQQRGGGRCILPGRPAGRTAARADAHRVPDQGRRPSASCWPWRQFRGFGHCPSSPYRGQGRSRAWRRHRYRFGRDEGSGCYPPPRIEDTDVPCDAGSRDGPNAGLARVGDNALLGLIRGWRRVASMAAAAELAAVAEFSGRRQAEAKSAGEWDSSAVDAADHDIAAALTQTARSTGLLIDRAMALRDLPAIAAALAAGQIDMPKALVFMTGLNGQDPELARTIAESLIGPRARPDHGPASRRAAPCPAGCRPGGCRTPSSGGGKAGTGRADARIGRGHGRPVWTAPPSPRGRGGLESHHGAGGPAPPVGCFRHPR